MEINEQKNNIQNEALLAWQSNNKCGTTEMITGVGKTFLALKALYTMPKHDQDTIHLFLAEQKDRLDDLIKDIAKFNVINDCNVMEDYNLQFQCYQTVYKWKEFQLGLVICDEIHDSLTPEYFNFYLNNTFEAILGLSAKVPNITNYTIKKITKFLKSKFKTSGNVKNNEENNNKIIQLSGDQRASIRDFLIEEEICDADQIILHGG